MTKDTFGEHLKREREMRGVSLDEIAAATRIATRFLQAIEDEHWDQLPGGVFNRGFVRAVARYLGLDEESTVAEYVSAAGDRTTVPVWTGSPPAVTPEQPWLAWILAAVVVLLLATAAWFAVRRFFAWRASRRSAPIAAQSAAWSPNLTVLASTTDSGRFSAERLRISSTDSTASPRAVIRWSPLAAHRLNLKSMPQDYSRSCGERPSTCLGRNDENCRGPGLHRSRCRSAVA